MKGSGLAVLQSCLTAIEKLARTSEAQGREFEDLGAAFLLFENLLEIIALLLTPTCSGPARARLGPGFSRIAAFDFPRQPRPHKAAIPAVLQFLKETKTFGGKRQRGIGFSRGIDFSSLVGPRSYFYTSGITENQLVHTNKTSTTCREIRLD